MKKFKGIIFDFNGTLILDDEYHLKGWQKYCKELGVPLTDEYYFDNMHGSTNNRESIKIGRGSEGCIRLLDEDIIHLKENYAQVGTKVIILPEDHGPLPFETRAICCE